MTALDNTLSTSLQPPGRSLWSSVRRRFLRNYWAVGGAVLLLIIMACCFGSLPYWMGAEADQGKSTRMEFQHVDAMRQGPGGGHWMGTDLLGRDLLGRLAV